MPEASAALTRIAPGLRLTLREGAPADLLRELLDGRHDAVIGQLPDDPALTCEELFRERLLLMMPAAHPLAAYDRVPPESLAGADILTLDARHVLHAQVTRLCETFGARLCTDYEGASLDALRRMTAQGRGLAFAPELYVLSEAPPGAAVTARPLARRALTRSIRLARRRSSPDNPALRLLAEAMRTAFAGRLAA
jgi:LysR family hydrogen peroxide-inducible transcriptional activator